MRRTMRLLVPALFTFASLLASPAAHHQAGVEGKASRKQENVETAELFASPRIYQIKIELSSTNAGTLEKEPKNYVRASVTEGGTLYSDIGLHLKGGTGSFRPLNEKPAFTLNFDRFKDGQKFHGLDKMHLNNCAQDETYMAELICSELFRAAGVPAARTTYARVELNGRDLGLYLLAEGIEKTFLRQYFSNAGGNLYESGTQQDITNELERTAGNGVRDESDLKAVAAVATDPDLAGRWNRLQPILDLERFISFMAIENLTWHADGYCLRKNNYRVYHDPTTGRLVFFPHGMDQMFGDPNGPILPDFSGMIARAVVETPEGRRAYHERMYTLFGTVFKPDALDARVNQLAELLRPVLRQSDPAAVEKFDAAVARLKENISRRGHSVEQQLKQAAR